MAPDGPVPVSSSAGLQRRKKPETPDKASHNAHIVLLQAQIDERQARILEIQNIINHRHVASPEFLQARNRLTELNSAFKAAVEAKRAHREELDLAEKVREKLYSDARALRQKLPFVRVDQIDEEIRKLEFRKKHTTISVEEEKKIMSQINNLQRSRACIKDQESRFGQDGESRSKIIEMLKQDDDQLNTLKAEQQAQHRILTEIREKEAAQIPVLIHERNVTYEKIKGLREEIKQAKVYFEARFDEYWRREREWRAQQAEDRKIRAERIHAERVEREKFRRQRELENYVEPYTDEIILCDQLICFIQRLAPTEEMHVAFPQQQITAPEGFGNAIISKKNRNEDLLDGWFGGFGGKKGKKGKPYFASAKNRERERIVLSLDVLTSFQKLNISPPSTHGDVSKSLSEVKEKKEEFLNMQKVAKQKREIGEKHAAKSNILSVHNGAELDIEAATMQEEIPAGCNLQNVEVEGDHQRLAGGLSIANVLDNNDKKAEANMPPMTASCDECNGDVCSQQTAENGIRAIALDNNDENAEANMPPLTASCDECNGDVCSQQTAENGIHAIALDNNDENAEANMPPMTASCDGDECNGDVCSQQTAENGIHAILLDNNDENAEANMPPMTASCDGDECNGDVCSQQTPENGIHAILLDNNDENAEANMPPMTASCDECSGDVCSQQTAENGIQQGQFHAEQDVVVLISNSTASKALEKSSETEVDGAFEDSQGLGDETFSVSLNEEQSVGLECGNKLLPLLVQQTDQDSENESLALLVPELQQQQEDKVEVYLEVDEAPKTKKVVLDTTGIESSSSLDE